MTETRTIDAPPLLAALRAAHDALDLAAALDSGGRVEGWQSLEGLTADELAEAVRLGSRLEGRVSSLRLQCVTAAERSGAAAGRADADAAAWAARAGKNRGRRWAQLWLARHLDDGYPATNAALASGRISEDHAAVIVRACENIPRHVRDALSDGDLGGCEEKLVTKASSMSPANLRRAARRFLEPLSERFADEHEEAALVAEEEKAERETWLTLGNNGDGTWTIKGVIPDLHAAILKKALDVLGAPRRMFPSVAREPDPTVQHWNYGEILGKAFCEVLEHLPTTGHARSGMHLVVHLDDEQLKERVGACTTDTGVDISTQTMRRLACDAGLLPFVLRGRSVPLDLGTSQRLFSKAQVIALSATYDTCAADGCDRPFAWTEIHHLEPWSRGGPTDLANAVPLCGHHHRRVHDPFYEHRREPDGTVVFLRRSRPSSVRTETVSHHNGARGRPRRRSTEQVA